MSEKIKIIIDKELEELIPDFLENRAKDIDLITQLISKSDLKTIESITHKIAGNAGGYGFIILGEIGKNIENASINNKMEIVKEEFEKMKSYLDNIEIFFQ